MLNRTGHFWEQRYYSSGFDKRDYQRALNTLRYIHANPKAANIQSGFFYDFSNYGVHDRLGDDGLGENLEQCAAKYRGFCSKYKPKSKPERRYYWGNKFLPSVIKRKGKKSKKVSPGQMSLFSDNWEIDDTEITAVAEKFIFANCYNPQVVAKLFEDFSS